MGSMLSKSSQMIRLFSRFGTLAKNAPLYPAFLRAQNYSFFARAPKILWIFSFFEENPFALKCHQTDMLLKMNDLTPNHFFANVFSFEQFQFVKDLSLARTLYYYFQPQMTAILTGSFFLMSGI